MEHRVFGIETEFGCLVRDPAAGTAEEVVERVKDYAFYRKRIGAIDLHARNYAFEPARSGGFLVNGGRLYVDAVGSHEEYATPECRSIFDAVCWDKAGQRLLQTLVNELGLRDAVAIFNNSVDHFGGHTFGCHENYLVLVDEVYQGEALARLIPFLVTRQIFAGAGRVGGHRLNRHDFRNNVMRLGDHDVDTMWVDDFYGVEIDDSVNYQLSQRADHIVNLVSSRVRFNRALINPRRDSFFDFSGLSRLHVLFGEANMSEYAAALKLGTTCLALSLIEMRCVPDDVLLADPLATLREVSRDPDWRWLVVRDDGSTLSAVDLQRYYLAAAQRFLRGLDPETDWVIREWEEVLDLLEKDPVALADRLDWVAKWRLLQTYMAAEGVGWDADVLHSLDLEYHDIDPERSLYHALVDEGAMRRLVTDEEIDHAMDAPPANTRALGRARLVRELISRRVRHYAIDWDAVYAGAEQLLELPDPFHTYEDEAGGFLAGLSKAGR